MAFSPDGERLLTGSFDPPAVTTWDVGAGGAAEVATYLVDTGGYIGMDYTADGDLVVGTGAGEATVIDTVTGQVVQKLGPHAGMPADALRTTYSVDVSPDGSLIATTGADETVSVWDPVTKRRCSRTTSTAGRARWPGARTAGTWRPRAGESPVT